MLDSVRIRLTLWYVGILALMLVGFSAAHYVMVARSLYDDLDDDLRLSLKTVAISQCAVDLITGTGREPSEAEGLMDWMARNEDAWRT